jgi:hypothetical protein
MASESCSYGSVIRQDGKRATNGCLFGLDPEKTAWTRQQSQVLSFEHLGPRFLHGPDLSNQTWGVGVIITNKIASM